MEGRAVGDVDERDAGLRVAPRAHPAAHRDRRVLGRATGENLAYGEVHGTGSDPNSISLHCPAVELLHRKRLGIDAFQRTHVDRRHRLAAAVRGLGEGMDTAGWAEPMLDE